MKIVVNKCYGGFELPKELVFYGEEEIDEYSDEIRTNKELVEFVESCSDGIYKGRFSRLKVVEIPDESTDYTIQEYDGFESLIYVLDGKLWFT